MQIVLQDNISCQKQPSNEKIHALRVIVDDKPNKSLVLKSKTNSPKDLIFSGGSFKSVRLGGRCVKIDTGLMFVAVIMTWS